MRNKCGKLPSKIKSVAVLEIRINQDYLSKAKSRPLWTLRFSTFKHLHACIFDSDLSSLPGG